MRISMTRLFFSGHKTFFPSPKKKSVPKKKVPLTLPLDTTARFLGAIVKRSTLNGEVDPSGVRRPLLPEGVDLHPCNVDFSIAK